MALLGSVFVSTPQHLSASQARRVALAANGFAKPRPDSPGPRQVRRVLGDLGQLQIDSVNVYERAHYLPLLSRLGPYPKAALDDLAGRHSIEYWPHQAGLIPAEDWPLWQWRRDEYASGRRQMWLEHHRELADWLLAELAERGAVSAGEIEHDRNQSRGAWWGWSDVKIALEYLWRTGEVVCLRRRNFERLYELPSALPAAARVEPVSEAVAVRELLDRAARALGVFTLPDLADYWRLPAAQVRPIIDEFVERGTFAPVRVESWTTGNGRAIPAWLHGEARIPRSIDAATVLSPFDPLVWFRPRAERLFDFEYRIEIYTPAEKRQFGYYSLPVLLGDQVVGRIDLKSDRKARTLLVQSAWSEPHAPAELGDQLRGIVSDAARWQGLERVQNANHGNLAGALPRAFELD